MKLYNIIVCMLLLSVQLASARLKVLDNKPTKIKLRTTQEMRFCYISFVDIDGTEYIIKQKKADFLRKIVSVVRDAITAHLVEKFEEHLILDYDLAHRIDIIPAGEKFEGKPSKEWPATIHTIAKGKMIKDQDSRYNSMDIKQADIGLRYDMLQWLAKDPVLIIVVALDIFCCNHDRHRGNLFYDQKTNSFCMIDMDSAFRHNLCALACQNVTKMMNNRKLQLNSKDIQVLITLKKHLQYLIDNNPPKDTVKIYNYFAEKAGFVKGAVLYTERVAEELEENRAMIIQSYEDAKKLVKILDGLIKKSQRGLQLLLQF